MSTTHTHSPLPWTAFRLAGDSYGIGAPESADLSGPHSVVADDVRKANALLIVAAVNSHDRLVRALQLAISIVEDKLDYRPDDEDANEWAQVTTAIAAIQKATP